MKSVKKEAIHKESMATKVIHKIFGGNEYDNETERRIHKIFGGNEYDNETERRKE